MTEDALYYQDINIIIIQMGSPPEADKPCYDAACGEVRVEIELRRAQLTGREFPTRTLSVCAAGS